MKDWIDGCLEYGALVAGGCLVGAGLVLLVVVIVGWFA